MDPVSSPDVATGRLGTVALLGNYLPRECGIATFTADLRAALQEAPRIGDCEVVAMDDLPGGYDYPGEVKFEINQDRAEEYRLAARFLNMNRVDTVCVQHEFGIYGGEAGKYLLDLLDELRMPVVTTLHTVLQTPDPAYHLVLERIAGVSDAVVAMTQLSARMLTDVYGVPQDRIAYIPHGIPDLAFVDPSFYKDQFGVEGKQVILTFGLLSPGKGIEYMIEALPAVLERFPDVVYIVLGKTHPHVVREQDEGYRGSLQRRARELGVEHAVVFHNEFVSQARLCEFLGCADLYVTPYLNQAQAVSGTLAYAMGAGKAVISTPYWHAAEMLADGRGRLVPFRDAGALGSTILELLEDPVTTSAMRKRAYESTREMTWARVAQAYTDLFARLTSERLRRYYSVYARPESAQGVLEIPRVKLDHVRLLSDHTGILQHARYAVPDKRHGYTTDDNSRALIAVLMARRYGEPDGELLPLATIYLSFLDYAFDAHTGRFRNFLRYDRTWMEEIGSEDSHGRALWALGTVVDLSRDDGLTGLAMELFEQALPAVSAFRSPRALAATLLGIHAFRGRFPGARATRRIRDSIAARIMNQTTANMSPDWPWPEDHLTYDNARLPHALLATGIDTADRAMIDRALAMIAWLYDTQTDPQGFFRPVGNQGWHPRGERPARYDQQPVEAEGMISACLEAYGATADEVWEQRALVVFDWFLGHNDLHTPVYDYASGGCHDGLQAQGVNRNEGAEATVSWLIALMALTAHRSRLPVPPSDTADSAVGETRRE